MARTPNIQNLPDRSPAKGIAGTAVQRHLVNQIQRPEKIQRTSGTVKNAPQQLITNGNLAHSVLSAAAASAVIRPARRHVAPGYPPASPVRPAPAHIHRWKA